MVQTENVVNKEQEQEKKEKAISLGAGWKGRGEAYSINLNVDEIAKLPVNEKNKARVYLRFWKDKKNEKGPDLSIFVYPKKEA